MLSKCRSSPVRTFQFTNLPDVPIDKVIAYLDADDLRRFHQVSTEWKRILESRPSHDERRVKLVKIIRKDKENIINRPVANRENKEKLEIAVFREYRDQQKVADMEGKKPDESPVLMEYTSHFHNTPTTLTSGLAYMSTPDCSSLLTPPSRFVFQDFQEAEQYLEPGQKLIQCSKCRGPVPSPISSLEGSRTREPRRLSGQGGRCKLVSRLQYQDVPSLETPQKREFKKPKTLSAVDLSPTSEYYPPVTVASLGEKMAQSLVLSSPCLSSSSSPSHATSSRTSEQFELSTNASPDIKRSTSYSSIDLPVVKDRERSPIDVSLNFSGNSFHKSLALESPRLDFHPSNSPNCSRSCCNYEPLYVSQLSDSGFSIDSGSAAELDDFSNFVPSPTVSGETAVFRVNTNYDNSIERVRDGLECNNSNDVLSLSSVHLQSSYHQGSSISNSMFIAPIMPNSPSVSTLECPNPTCRHRFCSECLQNEHPNTPCRKITSEQFESSFESCSSNYNEHSLKNSFKEERETGSSKKNKSKPKSHKKSSLKRLARL